MLLDDASVFIIWDGFMTAETAPADRLKIHWGDRPNDAVYRRNDHDTGITISPNPVPLYDDNSFVLTLSKPGYVDRTIRLIQDPDQTDPIFQLATGQEDEWTQSGNVFTASDSAKIIFNRGDDGILIVGTVDLGGGDDVS